MTFILSSQAQTCNDTLPITENFDDSNVVDVCWNVIDGDLDGYNWYWKQYSDFYGGYKCLTSKSFSASAGILTPDNWIISYPIDLTSYSNSENIEISYKVRGELVGFAHEGSPLLMKRVLNSVSAVVGMDGCSAYVYVNNIKVAEDGLERLYMQCRDNGAIYFKLEKAPTVTQENDSLTISFHDPVIRNDIELNPDIIVVEESLVAAYQEDRPRPLR